MEILAGVLLTLVQVEDPPAQKKIRPMPPAVQPQDGTCDGRCHNVQIEPAIAKMCPECNGAGAAACAHAKMCKECAAKKQVCAYCGRPLKGAVAPFMGRLQEALAKALPDHKIGRRLPNELAKKLLPRAQFYMVLHSGSPCTACAKNAEALAAIEFKDENDKEGTVRILASEKDLAELLVRQKLAGGPDAALCAAELVQALWQGKGAPEASEVKDGKASFKIWKGDRAGGLSVALDADGKFASLELDGK